MKSIFYLSFLSLFLLSCSKDSVEKETEDPQTKILKKIMSEDEKDKELQELISFTDSGEAQDEYNLGAYYAGKADDFGQKTISCMYGDLIDSMMTGVLMMLEEKSKTHSENKEEQAEKTSEENEEDKKKEQAKEKKDQECFQAEKAMSYYRDKAIVWLDKAAYKQYLPAIAAAGEEYLKKASFAELDEKSEYLQKAYSHLKEAVSRGDKRSHVFLARMYESGIGAQRDLKKALHHYKQSGFLDAKHEKELKERIEQEEKNKEKQAVS